MLLNYLQASLTNYLEPDDKLTTYLPDDQIPDMHISYVLEDIHLPDIPIPSDVIVIGVFVVIFVIALHFEGGGGKKGD